MFRVIRAFVMGFSIPLVLVVGLNICWVQWGTYCITSELQNSDPYLMTLARLAPTTVADEENVAARLQGLATPLRSAAKMLPADAFQPGPPKSLSVTTTTKLRLVMEIHRPTLTGLRLAAAGEHYSPNIFHDPAEPTAASIDWDRFADRLRILRDGQALLSTQVRLMDISQNGNEAADVCLTMLRLARHAEQEPFAAGHAAALDLRRQALHATNAVVQSSALSRARRDQLDRELAAHDLTAAYVRSIAWERALAMDEHFCRNEQGRIRDWAVAGTTRHHAARQLSQWKGDIEVATGSYATHPRASFSSAPKIKGLPTGLVRDDFEAQCVTLAELRCLRVINALRQRGVDQLAAGESLRELGLPEEIIGDPFDGKTLRVGEAIIGLTVYSVGKNLTDDGGKNLRSREDVGLAFPIPVHATTSVTPTSTIK